MADISKNTEAKYLELVLGAAPNQCDLAITSVDSQGSSGALNQQVFGALGYQESVLGNLDLSKGYALLEQRGLKPVILVVSVGDGNTARTLEKNLRNSLREHARLLANKRIWVPLMGTGAGGLKFDKSYEIIHSVLRSLPDSLKESVVQFVIAVPKNKQGRDFMKKMNASSSETTSNFEEVTKTQTKKVSPDIESFARNNVESNSQYDPGVKYGSEIETEIEQLRDTQEIEELIGQLNAKFYLVETTSENETKRFYKENSWKTTYDELVAPIVESIAVGAIIILKARKASTTRIRFHGMEAIGIVMNNPKNGTSLQVVWSLKDLKIGIENYKKYSGPIHLPGHVDVVYILSQLSKEQRNVLALGPTGVIVSTTIAGLISDSDSGEDHLEITKDVSAFARVIAAKSFIPPLAIALFGKWGSGKSFFMRKLKEQIQALSLKNSQEVFCSGIAHVHFNAWSYMDSNLWAGIITKIFEGLQKYISNDSEATKFKKEIEKTLTQQLNITHDELVKLESKKQAIDTQLKSLANQKSKTKAELAKKIAEIKNTTLKKVLNEVDQQYKVQEKIKKAIETNKSAIATTDKFAKIVPREYWQDPDELYEQTKSAQTFLKTFFKAGSWQKNLFWFMVILLVVIATPLLVGYVFALVNLSDYSLPPNIWYVLTPLGAIYVRGFQTFKNLRPHIAAFWKIKVNYELEKEDALFRFKQNEKALKLGIENCKDEINAINHQILRTEEQKAEIEFKLTNALSTEALYAFIEKRSSSEDYKKHLGIISVIRKDFEILSALFTDHNVELEKIKAAEAFKEKFDKPLERIILYIDDLDRCPEQRVVEVLEAVNLLMAYPLFVVVVGVDPRWVKNALNKKHSLQFVNNESQTTPIELIEPSAYLEKIFQVPFNLRAADDTSVKHMLKTLAEAESSNIRSSQNEEVPVESETDDKLHTETSEEELTDTVVDSIDDTALENTEISVHETIEALQFSEREIVLIQQMSRIVGPSPRAIKRFVNIYRIIKAHDDFELKNTEDEKELLAVLFLIALPIGKYRKLSRSFEQFILENDRDITLASYCTTLKTSTKTGSEHPQDDDLNLRTKLYNALDGEDQATILDLSIGTLEIHSNLTKRFSFSNV